jgi:hypothetical protein
MPEEKIPGRPSSSGRALPLRHRRDPAGWHSPPSRRSCVSVPYITQSCPTSLHGFDHPELHRRLRISEHRTRPSAPVLLDLHLGHPHACCGRGAEGRCQKAALFQKLVTATRRRTASSAAVTDRLETRDETPKRVSLILCWRLEWRVLHWGVLCVLRRSQ